jgi:3-isopropylmalate/(R)-2-methylmalate dehydratase small subunit
MHAIETITSDVSVLNRDDIDTDQIMPKQFLRGIDKAGLDNGLLWDLRFDADGRPRPGFVLNRPEFAGTRVLVAGPNFGCGSSREHAVWGLQQYGIQAVIASSFGEIFYSNAMNNGLMAVMVSEADAQAWLAEAAASPVVFEVDVAARQVRSPRRRAAFALSERHRRMFLDGLDMIGASLTRRAEIEAFAQRHRAAQPWLHDVARRTRERLDGR